MGTIGKYIDTEVIEGLPRVNTLDLVTGVFPERNIHEFHYNLRNRGATLVKCDKGTYITILEAIKLIRYSKLPKDEKQSLEDDLSMQTGVFAKMKNIYQN